MEPKDYEKARLQFTRANQKSIEAMQDLDCSEVRAYLGEVGYKQIIHDFSTTQNKIRAFVSILEVQLKQESSIQKQCR